MKFTDVFREPIYNISNFLSVLRVLLLPPFLYCSRRFRQDPSRLEFLAALIGLIGLAVLSDFLDGFLARRLNQVTMLGKYLDPVCDKIITIVALLDLTIGYGFPLWIFLSYLAREALGIWGGSFLYFKRDIQGTPNIWGKIGVGVVAIAVLWYMSLPAYRSNLPIDHLFGHPEFSAYFLFLVLMAGLVAYVKSYWRVVFRSGPKKLMPGPKHT